MRKHFGGVGDWSPTRPIGSGPDRIGCADRAGNKKIIQTIFLNTYGSKCVISMKWRTGMVCPMVTFSFNRYT